MKYLFLFGFCLMTLKSFTQTGYDTLKKYSYPISLYGDFIINGHLQELGCGTGFFIRSKNRLFFLTAYHVFTGYEYGVILHPIKTIRIKINEHSIFLKTVRDSAYEYSLSQHLTPDIKLIELGPIKLDKKDTIYDVSSFIDTSYFKYDPDIGICHGYTYDTLDRDKILHQEIIESYQPLVLSITKSTPLEIANAIPFDNIIYRLTTLGIKPGMSGAPVFGDYISSKGVHSIKFIGIAAQGAKTTIQHTYIARDSIVWRDIEVMAKGQHGLR